MRILILTIIPAILLSSCYSYKIFPKEDRKFTYTGEREQAFILNPGLSKEYEIFRKAGIFNFTNDSSGNSVIKIKLYPLQKNLVTCGEPILASFISLGQFPVLLPDQYEYRFDEIHGTDTIQQKLDLKLATRYWFWDMFAFKKNFKKKAAQTLLAGYYKKG